MMRCARWYGSGAGLLLLLMLLPALTLLAQEGTPPAAQEMGPNLLVNPGFEGIGKPVTNTLPNVGNWTRDTFNGAQYGEIFTPEGWAAWWEEGEYGRPECKVIPNEAPFNTPPFRVHAGYYATMCFGFYRKIHAGFYQVVRDIPPDSLVEGAFMAHSWSCGEDNPPLSCGDFTAFYFRVGIDPNGDTDPFSEGIVWSEPYYVYDKFVRVGPIQATVGITGVATLFLEATAKWPNKHNDAYWDNARLNIVVTGTLPTATPPPPPPTFAPARLPAAAQATPTPPPAGSIIHTVEEWDTWLGIAITYGVDPFDLIRFNVGKGNETLAIGQEVIVRLGPSGETAMPEAGPASSVSETSTAQPNRPAGDKGTICTVAFDDANGDRLWQANHGEMALPNIEIIILGSNGVRLSYRTDGVNEPHCFQDLPVGQSYIIYHTPPTGYTADGGPWNLLLSGGQVYPVELAYNRVQDIAFSSPSSSLIWRISGSLVLLLAGISGIYFILSRRG